MVERPILDAFDFPIIIFYGKKYTYLLHIMFVELVAIPTITVAGVMTALTVINFAGALFTVGTGIAAIAPEVIVAVAALV